MYIGGDFGKCTFPECDAAESIESGGSDAKSETEPDAADTFPLPHNTHTHSHTFSISFCCTKINPKGNILILFPQFSVVWLDGSSLGFTCAH